VEADVDHVNANSGTSPTATRRDLAAAGLVAGATLIGSLIPLLFNSQFYFFADTPDGAFGQWYELGQQLRSGNWPLMNPAAWMAGDYVAEGQWGLWNPLILAIGLFVSFVPSAVVSASTVKILFLVLGALGAFALIRSYRGSRIWAVVGAVAAPFAGFTLFMDAPSWVTNLFVWVGFCWAVAALRWWSSRGGWRAIPAFVACYLLITVGYVQGTLMLVFFFLASLTESVVLRRWSDAMRVLVLGASAGLVAVAVYLPGLLTAPVTARTGGIGNDGFMVLTLTGLATASVPSGQVDLTGWWGRFTQVPLVYIAWFLPLVFFVSGGVVRRRWRELVSIGAFGVIVLMLAVGPAALGPLRFPSRSMPWIALTAIVITVVVLSWSGRRLTLTATRCVGVGIATGFSYWLAFSQVPSAWKQHLAFGLVATSATVLVWALMRSNGRSNRLLSGAVMVLTTLVIAFGQSALFADKLVSRMDYPDEVSDYTATMPTGGGDGIVIGSPLGLPKEAFQEVSFANMWYLEDGTAVQNVYTPTEHKSYAADLCLTYDGRTCFELIDKLFSLDPTTQLPLADLLSLDTIQLVADTDHPLAELVSRTPPAGWNRSFAGNYSVVWTRDEPTGPAGEIVWASEGVEVTTQSDSADSVSFRVASVPPEGGTVAFSRIAWPGYTASGGTLGEPLRDYLLTVEVPASAEGKVVGVTFRPPGWGVILFAMISSVALAVIAPAASVVAARQAKRRSSLAPSSR